MKVKDSVGVGSIYNDGEYKAKNSDWHVADSPWKANQISKIINKNKIVASEICEVGCGAGEILRQLSLRSDFLNEFTG